MQIRRLSILDFKNIREAELNFSAGLNCFVGKNGEGKTNLLDAIHYIGFCKSHTNPIDSQNIHHEADFFMIQATCCEDEQSDEVYCGVKRRQKKVFKLNGKEYERLSGHIGKIPLVLISPSDEELIREGSDERRRFMDMVISQYDHAYMDALMAYNRALLQRNALLKDEAIHDDSLFEVYELKMEMEADTIFKKRKAFIQEFTPVFEQFYHYISGGKESIRLSYTSHVSEGDLSEQLKKTRQRDSLLGYTSKGIHKDELQMVLDGYPIKRVGSQGQNKSFLIAMKLGQYGFLKRNALMKPILLIDDLFDKLDASRVDASSDWYPAMNSDKSSSQIPTRNISTCCYKDLEKTIVFLTSRKATFRQRHHDPKKCSKIGEIIEELIKTQHLDVKLYETRLIKDFPDIVGKGIAGHIKNMYIQKGVLFISVDSSVIRNEMQLMRERLIGRLNHHVGRETIKDIVFR